MNIPEPIDNYYLVADDDGGIISPDKPLNLTQAQGSADILRCANRRTYYVVKVSTVCVYFPTDFLEEDAIKKERGA